MSTSGRILVVEDQESERKPLMNLLRKERFTVFGAENADKAFGYVEENIDVVLSDLHMGEVSGLELLTLWKKKQPDIHFIVLTGHSSIDSAVEAIKKGAFDYLIKPIDLEKLTQLLARAFEAVRLMRIPAMLPDDPGQERMMGRSPIMQEMYKTIGRIASQDVNVLILGESGTGKELVARDLPS